MRRKEAGTMPPMARGVASWWFSGRGQAVISLACIHVCIHTYEQVGAVF
jgi:hypothetical protein